MRCPLCDERKSRRACPGVGQQICSVCCGTKRLVEINCPPDCVYLTTAREHPAAAVVRRQQQDLGWLVGHMRDLNERQSRLFFLVTSFLADYAPADLQTLIDADVVEALGALAATLETSVRGVIYEHRPSSLPALRLADALKPVLNEVGKNGGTSFERDAAVVLRRVVQAANEVIKEDGANRRAFLDLVGRVIRRSRSLEQQGAPPEPSPPTSRLILP